MLAFSLSLLMTDYLLVSRTHQLEAQVGRGQGQGRKAEAIKTLQTVLTISFLSHLHIIIIHTTPRKVLQYPIRNGVQACIIYSTNLFRYAFVNNPSSKFFFPSLHFVLGIVTRRSIGIWLRHGPSSCETSTGARTGSKGWRLVSCCQTP